MVRGSAGFGRAAHWASSEAFSIGAAKTGEAMTSRSRRKRIRRFGRTRHERHPCGSEHGEGMEPISHGFAAPGSFPLAALSFTSCIRVLLHSVAWTWQAKSDFVARRGWRAIPGRRSNPPSGRLVGTTPSKITRPLGRVTKSPQSESSRIPAQGSGSHRHALAPKLNLGAPLGARLRLAWRGRLREGLRLPRWSSPPASHPRLRNGISLPMACPNGVWARAWSARKTKQSVLERVMNFGGTVLDMRGH